MLSSAADQSRITPPRPERQVREAWRSEELSERVEAEALNEFRKVLTREDHRARMDRRIGAKDFSGAMRAARRLGSDDRRDGIPPGPSADAVCGL
jgi:hypothetical protein